MVRKPTFFCVCGVSSLSIAKFNQSRSSTFQGWGATNLKARSLTARRAAGPEFFLLLRSRPNIFVWRRSADNDVLPTPESSTASQENTRDAMSDYGDDDAGGGNVGG